MLIIEVNITHIYIYIPISMIKTLALKYSWQVKSFIAPLICTYQKNEHANQSIAVLEKKFLGEIF